MKFFWPRRPKAKGFSIQNIAYKYSEKIARECSKKVWNHTLIDDNLKVRIEDSNHISISEISIKSVHWANRDFSEYKDAA